MLIYERYISPMAKSGSNRLEKARDILHSVKMLHTWQRTVFIPVLTISHGIINVAMNMELSVENWSEMTISLLSRTTEKIQSI